jgi:hypothetical protein
MFRFPVFLSGTPQTSSRREIELSSPALSFLQYSILLLTLFTSPCFAAQPAALISPDTVAAHGRQSALLTLKSFGRYSVTVASSQGVALQSMDKISGAGERAGEAGTKDGRLDLFLDRGEYKILTEAAENGTGQAKLSAHAFRELNSHPVMLVEERQISDELGDFEQRSYWLKIDRQRTVAIEAAGRHLADLRIWRDGVWLIENKPELSTTLARADHPLSVARLTAKLEPGLYLVTAYGGLSQPWTDKSVAQPFFLRFGIPQFASSLRRQFTMGELGIERFLVPPGANFFRLELPVADTAELKVGSYQADNPFQIPESGASIDKRSLPPVAELHDINAEGVRQVTVSMEPGKSYILQYFNASSSKNFAASGNYWISSIHAGHTEDSVGATAVLTRTPNNGREEYVDARTIDLSSGANWHRRFNLPDDMTLFIKVSEHAKIVVKGEGVKANYRFEPFLTSRPVDYQTPPWQESGHEFDLDAGLYVLTVTPKSRGILDLQLSSSAGIAGKALNLAAKVAQKSHLSTETKSTTFTPVSPVARFNEAQLGNATYTVYLNQQPGITSGVLLRKLPVNLDDALTITQHAGEQLTIPVQISGPGTLRAINDEGRSLMIQLDNGMKGEALKVTAGVYRATIMASNAVQNYSLVLTPARLASTTPLPPLPDATLANLPKFPVIESGAPHYLDIGRSSASSFQMQVEKPGFYQFETTGLLATDGKVRTRINPALFSATENGAGRNFMIQNYLREGEYQLTVSTTGQTQGHLGVQLMRTELVDGGILRDGEVVRALLPGAQALAYHFHINQRGMYHLLAMGQGHNFRMRLEDANGWPVFSPVIEGELTDELMPGDYRLIILPQSTDARVLTLFASVPLKKQYEGHGPHHIELESTVEHVWQEPAKDAARLPDQWEFDLPARADLNISLDNEMEATLVSVTDPKLPLAKIEALRSWSGQLPAGHYRVLAQNSRINNHVPYTLRISSTQLLDGLSREVLAPAVIPISAGSDGLVELQSSGSGDVRARLVDAAGALIAQNDDRQDDWNFRIAQRLAPGSYQLYVDPVNEKQTQTTVSMHMPREVIENPLALGQNIDIKDDFVHIYPLNIPVSNNLLLVSAHSADTVGIAVEGKSAQGWVNLGTTLAKTPYLVLPLGAERLLTYRLRAWSADRRSKEMQLRAVAASLPYAIESSLLTGGISLQHVDEARADLRVARVELTRPGTFRLKGDLAQWADGDNCAGSIGNNGVIGVNGRALWLVSEHSNARVLAERLHTPTSEGVSLRLALQGVRSVIDLQPNLNGPSLILAQTQAGQPGIAMSIGNLDSTVYVPGAAVTVALPGANSPAYVWNAMMPGDPIEMDVRQVPLQLGKTVSLGMGEHSGTISPRMTHQIKLQGGQLNVQLTLARLNAAVFLKQGAILSTHWSGDEPSQETITTDADELWLLNADMQDAQYGVEIAPATAAAAALKPGEFLEYNLSTEGRMRIPVEIPDSKTFHLKVTGNPQVLWLEKDGHIKSGNDIEIKDNGVLLLQHTPGTIVVWLEAAQGTPHDSFKSLVETPVVPPQTVNLTGKSQLLAFRLKQPGLLHLQTRVPVVTYFMVDAKPPQIGVYLQGANINLSAPAGLSRLVLRAVGADSLSGSATVTMTDVVNLSEGIGREVLLAPGGGKLFSFEIKQATSVGIGVRASSEIVNSVLYDASGAIRAQGIVQMPALEPGRYYLSIEVPADSAPVLVQPVIFGLNKPDTRPPYEILRRYAEGKINDALIYVPPQPAASKKAAPAADANDEAAPPSDDAAPQTEEDGSENPEPEQEEVK